MKRQFVSAVLLSLAGTAAIAQSAHDEPRVNAWLTTADRSAMLAEQPGHPVFSEATAEPLTIQVDPAKTFQRMDGFGFALTGGSAELLMKMSPSARAALLHNLFGSGPESIRVSYLRVSVGSSDMNEHVFTYDDMPEGQTDPKLKHFSLGPDMQDVIPVLKQILAIDPKISILATPWSAPSWMKSNDLPKGGNLQPQWYPVYARYLVRYLEAMKAQGIPIRSLTIQNEPLNPKNTPSMVVESSQEADFLANDLGPALHKAHLKTEVILYDHNLDRPDYALDILANPKAAQYATGSGWHLYGGTVDAMTKVHDAYPQKGIYFTEQMVVQEDKSEPLKLAGSISHIVIGATRNWSKLVLLWNLAADPHDGPHTNDGGCPVCQGAITIDGNDYTRNLAYDTIAQVSKFVGPGAERIASQSSTPDQLPNVAFLTPEGREVLLVANPGQEAHSFSVEDHGRRFNTKLGAGDVVTFTWQRASASQETASR